MTSQSPRIYTYKITFEEVPYYYYYGMHEEKIYDEEYWGSPVTHKWCWKLYTPKKQILETFSNREDANQVERRLIKTFYNTDKWCLNENCGGFFSLDTCSKAGKIAGKKSKELGVGVHGRTKEQMTEDGKKGGLISGELSYKMKIGVHGRNKKQMIYDARMGGLIGGELSYKMKVGIHARTKEQIIEDGRKGGSISGKNNYKNGIGLASITKEERKEIVAKTNSQKWMCLETGYITTSGPLTKYQRAKGIDTSKRIKLD